MALEILKKTSRGCFILFLTKENIIKKLPSFAGDYVWPSFVRVSNGSESCIIEGPWGDGIV